MSTIKFSVRVIVLLQCLVMCFFYACSSNQTSVKNQSSLFPHINSPKKSISPIITEFTAVIINHCYDYKTNRIIEIAVNKTGEQFTQAPHLLPYFIKETKNTLKEYKQLKLVNDNDPNKETTIEMLVFREDGQLKLSTIVYDNKRIPYNSKIYLLSEEILKTYAVLKYKKKYEWENSDRAFLKIHGNNKGYSYHSNKRYFSGSKLEKKLEKAYYPIEQKCILNGKVLRPNNDKIYFNGKVAVGKLNIVASLKGAEWDGTDEQQNAITNTMKKM